MADRRHLIGMCILHADFHEMDGECWDAVIAYQAQGIDRDLYQALVERAILDEFIREEKGGHGRQPDSHRPTKPI